MASAAPLPEILRRERLIRYAKLAVGALSTAILGGLVAAYFTYLFTARLNTESAVQQQYLAAIQDFSTTGAKVDASVTELADTVLDGQQLMEARREARQAIAAHVAASLSLSPVAGEANVEEYMKGLATLRLFVDRTTQREDALRTSRARFDLMSNRTIMIAESRKRVYGDS